jgi:hypothetical protein
MTRPGSPQASLRSSPSVRQGGKDRSRLRFLPGIRQANWFTEARLHTMALRRGLVWLALQGTVQRAPFLRELEPDDRQKPDVVRPSARVQRAGHVGHVWGWIEGSTEADIEAIKHSMQSEAVAVRLQPSPVVPENPHAGATKVPPERVQVRGAGSVGARPKGKTGTYAR